MSKTVADLAKKTMQNLGLLEAQEDVSSEDFALISDAYSGKYAWLTKLEPPRVYWPEATIPDEAFLPLAMIMAAEVAPSFGKTEQTVFDEDGKQLPMGAKGMYDLKRLTRTPSAELPARAFFF